jgi:hypothetical protein
MFNYDNTGIISPDVAAILQATEDEYTDPSVFGSSLSTVPSTPQGMFIASDAAGRTGSAQVAAAGANNINPNFAGGVFLDAIMKQTGSERKQATTSFASITLSGVPGTFIDIGTKIQSSVTLELFENKESTTLDGSGNGFCVFYSINSGPIAAPAGTLNQISSGPDGLETVNNILDAEIGADTQSDQSARIYRKNTLFLQGSSLSEAMVSGVVSVLDVVSKPSFRENKESTNQTIDGIVMAPKSIYMCVDGGTDLDVATMIYNRKSGGCAYNNGASMFPISKEIIDPVSGQSQTVLFDRPDILPILVEVYVKRNFSISNIVQTVIDAILKYCAGEQENRPGLIIGQSVSSFELSAAVNIENPNIFVKKVLITLASLPVFTSNEIPIALWQKASIQSSSINVIVEE